MPTPHKDIVRHPEPLRSGDTLAEWLRQCRRDRGMTQADLAARSGITKTQISRIEGSIVDARISTVFALVAAMGLDLVGGPRGMHLGAVQTDTDTPPAEPRHTRLKDLF